MMFRFYWRRYSAAVACEMNLVVIQSFVQLLCCDGSGGTHGDGFAAVRLIDK